MDISGTKEGQSQAFTGLAIILFLTEWIRGAVLVSYLPAYAMTGLGLSTSALGIAVSVHYLTDSLIKGLAGYLLDRFPGRIVLHGGFIIGFTGLALLLTAHNPWLLIAAAALMGAGFSPIWILCMSQVKEDNRAQQMGTLYMFWMAGLGLGPVTMNLIVGRSIPLSLTVIAGVLAAGWITAVLVKLDRCRISRVKVSAGEQLGALWSKVKKGGFLLPGMLLQTTAGGMLVPLLTSFAVQHVGLSHSELSIVLLIGGGGAVLLLVPMGKWFDHTGGRWFLVSGFGVFAAALFALTSVSTFTGAAALSLLLGSAYAALLPAWNALMARYIPEEAVGVSWGLLSSVEGLGVVIGPVIGGWLASYGDGLLPFRVSAFLFAVIGLVYLMSPSLDSRPAHPTVMQPSRKELR
ncbi:MFS transporter [Paenibacillus stellifer]|uniref:MFS transporter n=1 Tax=Paenibacillus stellifer TaxID=169760 RepID=UPI00068A012D|nr:MFS transporter [Paenibacillus stellifer]